MSKLIESKQRLLPVHIVEQHNDVVPFIHRAIASKQLPFTGIPIIHFDSHPDLLISIHLDADDVFKPRKLYESISIENWLLPLAYGKHVDHVVWVKPPWANQIKASEQSFHIGKCKNTGKLRLSCKENYFLTDGLFCSPSSLDNSAICKLSVVQLCPPSWSNLDPMCTKSNQKAQIMPESKSDERKHKEDSTQPSDLSQLPISCEEKEIVESCSDEKDKVFEDFTLWTGYLQDTLSVKPFILDIDLDFFSVKDPFQEIFEVEKSFLQILFACPPITGQTDQEIAAYTVQRQRQLSILEDVFTSLHNKWSDEDTRDDVTIPSLEELSSMSLADITGLEQSVIDKLTTDDQSALRSLCIEVFPRIQAENVTFDQVFNFGCTLDDTSLPHHVSTDAQINALVNAMKNVLCQLSKPAIITISRSSYDDYCPIEQVDRIERLVLKELNDCYGSLDITRNYDE